MVVHILRGLDRRRFEPALFVLKREGVYWCDMPDDVEITVAVPPGRRIRHALCRIPCALLAAAQRSDVIVGGVEYESCYLASMAGIICRRPVVGLVHTVLAKDMRVRGHMHKLWVHLAYPHFTTAVAVSHGVAEALHETVPCLRWRTRVIYNPLPVEEIRSRSLEPVNMPFPRPVVLGVGRLARVKQFDLLIHAHARIIARNLPHSLVILGEGEERHRLEVLASHLGVSRSVHIVGFQKNPYTWMARADLLAVFSAYEGFSMVVLEAMATGLPVVAGNCPGGLSEMLGNQRCGVLVPPNDADALAVAIMNVLTDRQLAHRLRQAGLQRANDFSFRNIIPQYETLFLKLAGNGRLAP